MADQVSLDVKLEIGHVVFIDIVDYATLLITDQRIMDCGDAGNILLSQHVADDLEQYPRWRSLLHDLGECEVKHGVRVHAVNLYTDEVGNSAVPEKLRQAKTTQPVPAISISR